MVEADRLQAPLPLAELARPHLNFLLPLRRNATNSIEFLCVELSSHVVSATQATVCRILR